MRQLGEGMLAAGFTAVSRCQELETTLTRRRHGYAVVF